MTPGLGSDHRIPASTVTRTGALAAVASPGVFLAIADHGAHTVATSVVMRDEAGKAASRLTPLEA